MSKNKEKVSDRLGERKKELKTKSTDSLKENEREKERERECQCLLRWKLLFVEKPLTSTLLLLPSHVFLIFNEIETKSKHFSSRPKLETPSITFSFFLPTSKSLRPMKLLLLRMLSDTKHLLPRDGGVRHRLRGRFADA